MQNQPQVEIESVHGGKFSAFLIIVVVRHVLRFCMFSYFAVLSSPKWDKIRAMQVEWLCRFPTRKKPRPRKFIGLFFITSSSFLTLKFCRSNRKGKIIVYHRHLTASSRKGAYDLVSSRRLFRPGSQLQHFRAHQHAHAGRPDLSANPNSTTRKSEQEEAMSTYVYSQ